MNNARHEQLQEINRVIRLLIWYGHKQSVDAMEQMGLTLPQTSVLFSLEASGGQATMSDIARMGQVTPATVTGIVDRLIALDFVVRERDESDRRVVWVRLTPAGQAKIAEIHTQRFENMTRFTQSFSDTELRDFKSMLERLLNAMIQESSDPGRVFLGLDGLL